jgi:hypothetical protein
MESMRHEVSVPWPGETGSRACRAVAFLSSISSVAFLSSETLAKGEAKAGLPTVVSLSSVALAKEETKER